jgi:ribonuclease-3
MADPDAAVAALRRRALAMARRPTGEALASQLAAITGHVFRDFGLMQRALTHSSARGASFDNERLEFLGDRVLGLVVTDMLFRAYPEATQGELAVRLSFLVSGAACAEIADEIGLTPLIHAEAGLRSRGRSRNVPADALEALIAALYLDGGMTAADAFVRRFWEPRARAVATIERDPKTELQEWAHKVAASPPIYQIDGRMGPDHEPLFSISVRVAGREPATGTGRSKREAEQAAALAMLVREGVRETKGDAA